MIEPEKDKLTRSDRTGNQIVKEKFDNRKPVTIHETNAEGDDRFVALWDMYWIANLHRDLDWLIQWCDKFQLPWSIGSRITDWTTTELKDPK